MDFRENVERSFRLSAAYSLNLVQSLPRVLAPFLELRYIVFDVVLRSIQRCNARFLDWSVGANAYSALLLNCLFQLSQLVAQRLEVNVPKPPASHSVHFREPVQPDYGDIFRQVGSAGEVFRER